MVQPFMQSFGGFGETGGRLGGEGAGEGNRTARQESVPERMRVDAGKP